MIFADLLFLYIFLPAVALLYAGARCIDRAALAGSAKAAHFDTPTDENRFQNYVLILFSVLFYAWGEPVYILLMLFSVVVNYIVGRCIGGGKNRSKTALIVGIAINIAMIGVFKYAGFIVSSINVLGLSLPVPEIGLPIGISFYTFQSMSYVADVYMGRTKPQDSFYKLLLYISMFPQLIAGPIVRYTTIAEEINVRSITFSDLADGSFRFLVGLGKKVILANQLSEISSAMLDGNLDSLPVGGAWLGLVAFTFQIYFDFSGYSDMAIGMGRCFGFHFDENFDTPYISKSITEFWRRWHISLGSFFRDYVYIPLGGNRKHQPFNIMIVWLLTGLWHGASWNFVLWGVYFGIIILVEKYTLLKVQEKLPAAVLHVYSLFLIIFGWAIFYFEDFGRLGQFVGTLFGFTDGGLWSLVVQNTLLENIFLLIAAVVCSLPFGSLLVRIHHDAVAKGGISSAVIVTSAKTVAAVALLVVSTLLLIGNTNNPFLYLRF